jgi:hypothetical protein
MTSLELLEFIEFVSDLLYMLIAFMCGLIIGYIVGFNNNGGPF